MNKLLGGITGLVMLGLASVASATIITLPFTIEIEQVTGAAEGVAVGKRYNGAIRYDDTDLTPDGSNFVIGNSLEIDFAFTRGENFVPPELTINGASITASGALADLDFSVDFPVDLYFQAKQLVFGFEFSKEVENPDDPEGPKKQEMIAIGRGFFVVPTTEVSAPATALLLLPVAVMLAQRRRLRRD